MTKLPLYLTGALALLALGTMNVQAAEPDAVVVQFAGSPEAIMQAVPIDDVQWTDGFWAERSAQNATTTLHALWDLAADPDMGHVLDNMRIAAGLQKGKHEGTTWQDAWLYKWIEAAACVYRVTKDPWVAERMDEAVALIVQAQEPDGYIGTQTKADGLPRFEDPRNHEVYTMGHLLTATVVHHRMTGEDDLLNVATRCADFLCKTLGKEISCSYAHNPSAIMGMIELYRETGEQRYLDCAKLIVDQRGATPMKGAMFYREKGIIGTDLIQDRIPLRQSTEVVGHNVFFTYLFAGAADVFLETGDNSLVQPLETLWSDLTGSKICINGGVSPMGRGVSIHGDPVIEAVGTDFFLPTSDCYNETCGQVGNFMWNYRMLARTGEARFADVMEQELYNGFLAGVGLDGESWFYRNILRRYETDHESEGLNDMPMRDKPGRKQICCPTNILRTLAELQTYSYSVSDKTLWLHHFGGNICDTEIPGVGRVRLVQETAYPWDGKVALKIEAVEGEKSFTLRVRIPEWAEARAEVNGNPLKALPTGRYLSVNRTWKAGDQVVLHLPMPARLMQANPKAEQLRNQAAVMRGPVLYCLESPDLPANRDLFNVCLPSDIGLKPAPAKDLPFGITTLQGTAVYRPEATWNGLYRPLQQEKLKPQPVTLIPYFAWSNRGPSTMSVWLPIDWRD